jgi:hypothetical protein
LCVKASGSWTQVSSERGVILPTSRVLGVGG